MFSKVKPFFQRFRRSSHATQIHLIYVTESLLCVRVTHRESQNPVSDASLSEHLKALVEVLEQRHGLPHFTIFHLTTSAGEQHPPSPHGLANIRQYNLLEAELDFLPSAEVPLLHSLFSFCKSMASWVRADRRNVAIIFPSQASEAEHARTGTVGWPFMLMACYLTFCGQSAHGADALDYIFSRFAIDPADGSSFRGDDPRSTCRVSPSVRRYLNQFSAIFNSSVIQHPLTTEPALNQGQQILSSLSSASLRLDRIELTFQGASPTENLSVAAESRLRGQAFCVHVFCQGKRTPVFTSIPWEGSNHRFDSRSPQLLEESSRQVLRSDMAIPIPVGCTLEGDVVLDFCHVCLQRPSAGLSASFHSPSPSESSQLACHRLFELAFHAGFVLPCGAVRVRKAQVDLPPACCPSGFSAAHPSSECPFCVLFKNSNFSFDLVFANPPPSDEEPVQQVLSEPQQYYASRIGEGVDAYTPIRWLDGGPITGPAPDDSASGSASTNPEQLARDESLARILQDLELSSLRLRGLRSPHERAEGQRRERRGSHSRDRRDSQTDEDDGRAGSSRSHSHSRSRQQIRELFASLQELDRMTGEELVQLTRRMDVVSGGGSEDHIISQLPTYPYRPRRDSEFEGSTSEKGSSSEQEKSENETHYSVKECMICLCDYEVGETLKVLPCIHQYHAACIDKWLHVNLTCPSCLRPVDLSPHTTVPEA